MTNPANSPKYCGCGCGQPVSAKATFRQGHDQALISKLAGWTCHATLDVVTVTRMGLAENINDQAFIDRIAQVSDAIAKLSSPSLANKFYSAAMRRWDRGVPAERTKTPVDVEKAVAIAEDLATKPSMTLEQAEALYTQGTPVRVKVGRWEYDATVIGMNQAGKVTAVRYKRAGGKEVVRTEGQFTLVER